MTEQFLTVEEAAVRLKVAPFTVRAWLRQGKIEGVKLGKVWRVLVASIDALARPKQDVTTAPQQPVRGETADERRARINAAIEDAQRDFAHLSSVLGDPATQLLANKERVKNKLLWFVDAP